MNVAKDLSLNLETNDYQTIFVCSRVTDTNCYFTVNDLLRATSKRVVKFDYNNTETCNFLYPNDANIFFNSITPVDGENFIVAGFDANATTHKYVYFSANFSSSDANWIVEADTFGKYLNSFSLQIV